MRAISKIRFDALAGYCRDPRSMIYGEELTYFEHGNERALGMIIRDRTDGDYAGMVLAHDELKQYRWTNMTAFVRSERWAKALLRSAMEQAAMASDEEHHQGHKNAKVTNFFNPVRPDGLHPDFSSLAIEERFSAARGIIEPMMRWYHDVDGNFIEQFQTAAFDARIWELYLFALLVEASFAVDRSKVAPDFVATGLLGKIAIEAVTVNPTIDRDGNVVAPPPTDTPERREEFLREYMPIKFGSALYSKLNKEYWAKQHVRGIPLAFAIQDFSAKGSMVFTRSALTVYLYGFDHDWTRAEDGKLLIMPRRVVTHKWDQKEIPSGFFFLPGAENISAVLFSNSGTISKFNRMGLHAGFGSPRIRMIRRGFAVDHNPNSAAPLAFVQDLSDPNVQETWIEGLDVFHNPRASNPIREELLPGAAHHYLDRNGQIRSTTPGWHPLTSHTLIFAPSETEPTRSS